MAVGRHGSWEALPQVGPKEIVVNVVEPAVRHMPGAGKPGASPKVCVFHFISAELAGSILDDANMSTMAWPVACAGSYVGDHPSSV